MAIHVHCACGKRFLLDERHLGGRLRCKACGRQHLLVPEAPLARGGSWVGALAGILIGVLVVAVAGFGFWQSWPASTRAAVTAGAPSLPGPRPCHEVITPGK